MIARIYKIVCNKTGMVYVGSTVRTLKRRLSKHKTDYKCYLDGKTNYRTSFEIIDGGDYYIDLIEEFEYDTKRDILDKEGVYIREIDCVNRCVAGRTKKEYDVDNKEKIKKYREENKEKLQEYHKKYNQENKDKKKEYNKKYLLYKTEITRLMNISL